VIDALVSTALQKIDQFDTQGVSNMMNALLFLQHYPRPLFVAFWSRLAAFQDDKWSNEELSQLSRIVLCLRLEKPDWNFTLPLKLAARAKTYQAAEPSKMQLRVSEILRSLGIACKDECLMGELSVDIVIDFSATEPGGKHVQQREGANVLIEVDGPAHYCRVLGGHGYDLPTLRTRGTHRFKQRLLEHQGFTVLHVPFFEWTPLNDTQRARYLMDLLQPHNVTRLPPDPSPPLVGSLLEYDLLQPHIVPVNSDSLSCPPARSLSKLDPLQQTPLLGALTRPRYTLKLLDPNMQYE
jgi:hypothetical protein